MKTQNNRSFADCVKVSRLSLFAKSSERRFTPSPWAKDAGPGKIFLAATGTKESKVGSKKLNTNLYDSAC